MSEQAFPVDDDVEGPAAPPRANGELLFEEAWEARAFGMVVALHHAGLFAWDQFRDLLIDEISQWDSAHSENEDYRYYDRWIAAFERLAQELNLIENEALNVRVEALSERPHGHDH